MISHQKVSFSSSLAKMFQAKLTIVLVLSLFYFSFTSHAETIASINTLSNVSKIIQDKQGIIWLSGQQGLTRVDGNRNINFTLNSQEWPLPDSWINDISLIDDKFLLATETEGLWVFDPSNGKAEQLKVDIPKKNVFDAVKFKDKYFFYSPDKLYSFNPTSNETRVIAQNITINKLEHTQHQLYITNSSGLYHFQNDQLIQIINEPITAITTLTDMVIAITSNKIYRLGDDGKLSSIDHNEKIYGLTGANDNESFFTINSEGKVSKYKSKTLTALPHHYSNSKLSNFRAVLHDASGVLWLASNHGIERLNESYITNHKVIFDISINANEITLFDNEIIIGSYGAGLQNFLEPIFPSDVNANFTKKGQKTFDVLEVNSDLYIASLDGLWRYDKDKKQVTKLNIVDDKLVLKLELKNNILYIATNDDGLYLYDLTLNKIINHVDVIDGLPSSEIIDVLALNADNLWIASSSNINIYQSAINKVITLDTPNRSKVISLVYADNKIFASTLGDGILVFNQQGDLLTQISKGYSFTEMLLVNDEIWVSGKPGLYRLSPKNYQITMIENTQQYSFVSSMLVKDETLYAIHYGGVLAINLSEQRPFSPNVIISKTTISGRSYLLNKAINIASGNDVITLDLASLDYRPGLAKQYQYRINNSHWQQISNNQLTLTGLASGDYSIEIMATNSLGQWSSIRAYTEINVASPWYWTVELRIIYSVFFLFILLLSAWLLYLRTKSINHIHNLLKDDMRNYGKTMKIVQRNLHFAATSLENDDLEQGKQLINKSLLELKENISSQEPDNLEGKPLSIAIPFLADYVKSKYQIKLHFTLDDKVDTLSYELRSDVYKVIFEALISAIFKSKSENFNLTLQEVKNKLWLTITSEHDCFSLLDSKVNFDLAGYTVRQIVNKHQASLNTFDNDDGSSQLVISFPLMSLN